MGVIEKAAEKIRGVKGDPEKTPPEVKAKLLRGRERLQQLAAYRQEAIEFANNNHFVSISEDGRSITPQALVALREGGGKPDHRVRRSHDLIGPIVKRKVSASTQRIPSYEINASTPDPEDYAAAKIAEKIAVAGYEMWSLKRAFKKLVWNALVTEEGFIMASWDSSIGPFVDVSGVVMPEDEADGADTPAEYDTSSPAEGDAKPKWVGMGEVDVGVWGGLEVMWEPGVEFEKSRWYAIESGRSCEAVEAEDGYEGPKLKPDADYGSASAPKPKEQGSKLVMVTEYFERPCPRWPEGRRLIFANEKRLFPEEEYPLRDPEGKVVDKPCLHRLAYSIDGSSDRDKGLVPSLVDAMRSYDLAVNKTSEWIQVALTPQMAAPEGAILTPITDEPGLVIEYDPTIAAGQQPVFRQVPQVPQELFIAQDRAKAEMAEISHDSQMPEAAPSGAAVTAVFERDQLAWQDFIFDLAEVHARLMRDCLTIVQQRYTEERMVTFRGRTGWENIPDFMGADIREQTDVRVQPGSLESRTRGAIEAKIAKINEMFPGYFSPPVVIAALNSAEPEKLIEGFEQDEARAQRVISLIKTGEFWHVPDRPVVPGEEAPQLSPETGEVEFDQLGQPVMLQTVPGWMPRPFDNVDIHRAVFEGWMKTDDYEQLDEESKKAAMIYYQALQDLETRAAARKAELQNQMAEERGIENAAKPGEKQMPSGPSIAPGEEPAPPGAPAPEGP